jgi:AcrR family transcriptional regulator
VHGWLERERPEVFVLTDGSGSDRESRVPSTAELLRRAGARPGSVFGRFSDRELYEVILEGRIEVLAKLVGELADALIELGVEMVAADAIEGYNPSHDVCRVLTDAAVQVARRRTGRAIASYDFLLEGRSDVHPGNDSGSLRFELEDGALERKLAAARSYPEMAYEVDRAFERHGAAAFRIECLRPVDPEADVEALVEEPPYYETYGEQQVAAGRYPQVLRFREHFLPLARALRELGRTV